MKNDNRTDGQIPEWEKKAREEVMAFVGAVQHNFKFGIEKATAMVPDPTSPAQRAQVLDLFLDASFGLAVQFVAEYFNPGERAEVQSLKMVQEKFAYVRSKLEDAAKGPQTLGRNGLKPVLSVT